MIPPALLVDTSIIRALLDDSAVPDVQRHLAHETFALLLERYERHERRLVARADHLRAVERSVRATLFGPVGAIHVARQHLRLAERAPLAGADGTSLDPDQRITLVVLRHERIAEVAACGPAANVYAGLGLTVVGVAG